MTEAVALPILYMLLLATVTIPAALISRDKGKFGIFTTGVVVWIALVIVIPALSGGPELNLTFEYRVYSGFAVGCILALALAPLWLFGSDEALGKRMMLSIVGAVVTAPVAIFLLLAFLPSYEFDYEYISLIQSMEVVKTGQPGVSGIHDHSEMPLQYRLERDTYVIHAVLDERANRPTIIFSIESKHGDNLYIRAHPIRCHMYEDAIHALDVEHRGFPADGVKLVWSLDRLPPPCDLRTPLSEVEKVIRLSVIDASRVGIIADENIQFSVERNGSRIIYDGL